MVEYDKTTEITKERFESLITSYDTLNVLKLNDTEVGEHVAAEIVKEPEIIYFVDKKRVNKEDYYDKEQEINQCPDETEKSKLLQTIGRSGSFFLKHHGRRQGIEDFEYSLKVSSGCVDRFIKKNPNPEEYVGKFCMAKKTAYGQGFPQHVNVIKKEGFSLDKPQAAKPFQARQEQDSVPQSDTVPEDYIKGYTSGRMPEERSQLDFMLTYYTSKYAKEKNQLLEMWKKVEQLDKPKEDKVSDRDKVFNTIKESEEIKYDDLLSKSGVEAVSADKLIEHLLNMGEIFEIKPGTYRVLQ